MPINSYNTQITNFLTLLGFLLYAPAAIAASSAAATAGFSVVPPGNPGTGPGIALGFTNYLASFFIPIQGMFVGFLFFFLFLYAATMVFYGYNEGTLGESKQAFTYGIAGIVVVSLTFWIAGAVLPGKPQLVNAAPIAAGLWNVIAYAKGAAATFLLVNIVIQGFRLISSQGEQEYVDRARKRLTLSLIGIVLVMLANAIVFAVSPETGANLNVLTTEMVGLANFLLTLIGAAVVLAVIIAGILLVISVDESLKDKAKQIIKTALVVLVVVLLSFVLVNAFLSIPA